VTRWLERAAYAIAVITVASGGVQLLATGWELELLQAQQTPAARHFFAIVGMFMVLFGGLLLHGLRRPHARRVALTWAALQKVGASAAVGLGVLTAVFSPLALLVAGFDLLSAAVLVAYLWIVANATATDGAPLPTMVDA
jgi:hypothetical protein